MILKKEKFDFFADGGTNPVFLNMSHNFFTKEMKEKNNKNQYTTNVPVSE